MHMKDKEKNIKMNYKNKQTCQYILRYNIHSHIKTNKNIMKFQ